MDAKSFANKHCLWISCCSSKHKFQEFTSVYLFFKDMLNRFSDFPSGSWCVVTKYSNNVFKSIDNVDWY